MLVTMDIVTTALQKYICCEQVRGDGHEEDYMREKP